MIALSITIGFVVFILALWRLSGRIAILSPVNTFAVFLIVFHAPLVLIDKTYTIAFASLALMSLAALTIGALLASQGQAVRTMTLCSFDGMEIKRNAERDYYLLLSILLVYTTAISILYYRGLPPLVNLYQAIVSGEMNLVQTTLSNERRALTKSHYFGGAYTGQGALKVFMTITWTYVLAYAAAGATFYRSKKTLLTLGLVAALSFLFLAGGGIRAPFLLAVAATLCGISYTLHFSLRRWMKWLGLAFVIMFTLTLLVPRHMAKGGGMVTSVSESIVNRIYKGNGYNSSYIYRLIQIGTFKISFGQNHKEQFLNALPGIQSKQPFANRLYHAMEPSVRSKKTTYASFTYLGSLYLDFGALGMFIVPLLLGFVYQRLHFHLLGLKKNVLTVALISVVAFEAGNSANTSPIQLLVNFIPLAFVHGMVLVVVQLRKLANVQAGPSAFRTSKSDE